MNSYELSRKWFDWSFENPEKISPNHSALYFFAIEHCNRLGWRKKFGFPTEMAKDAIGIKSYKTYINTLNDLVDWGFIEMVEKSKNQYSANIIALAEFTEALDKALDKAMVKHVSKQVESTYQSNDTIDKHITIKPLTNKQETNIETASPFSFYNSLINAGGDNQLVSDWLRVRKNKKATNTQTAYEGFIKEVYKSNQTINQALTKCVENSWSGYKSEWITTSDNNFNKNNNGKSTITDTNEFKQVITAIKSDGVRR